MLAALRHAPRAAPPSALRLLTGAGGGPRAPPEAAASLAADLRALGVPVSLASEGGDAAREVKLKSRDFFWYSPVLKETLRGLHADCLVTPTEESHVLAALAAAARLGVPLTPRGAGTGNYGQAVPLRGGAVLDLSGLRGVVSLDPEAGKVRAWAGTLLGQLEDECRSHGWELRQHPSTRRTATVGGFVCGGSTGVGGLLHGGLAEDGAVLGARVATAEDPPRVLELSGRDVFPVVHAYGTNGVLTQVELPLARAQPWHDAVCAFGTLSEAARFGLEVGEAPAVVARAASVFQAPTAELYFPSMVRLPEADRGAHLVLVQCAETSLGPLERLARDNGGRLSYCEPEGDANVPLYEYCWNHTTLLALKKDKSVTYMQGAMEPARCLELVSKVEQEFGPGELLQHLEVLRFGGRVGFATLALLKPRDNARLRDMLAWHEANGVPVFDPHTHVLEDGGMKQTDWAQLGFKARADPSGILNPGKMRAWEEGKATAEAGDPRGAFTAAYRVADTSSLGAGAGEGAPCAPQAAAPEAAAAPRSRFWAEWSTRDFAAADLRGAVAVLPIGAVEAHGPHLPLGVDAMHNEGILGRALELLPPEHTVLALPPMDVGASCEHVGFAGTLSLRNETAAAVWEDVGACVARAGVRKLVLYNSHGGNHALAEVVARKLRLEHGMLVVLALNLGMPGSADEMFPDDELRYGIHGGAIETSVMLHLRPGLVGMEHAERFESSAARRARTAALQTHQLGFGAKTGWLSQDLNAAGVVGDAKGACAEKGARLVEDAAEGLRRLLVEVCEADVDELLGTEPRFPPQGAKRKEE